MFSFLSFISRILQQHKEIEEDLRHLLKQCKYFLRSQQRTFESSMQSLRSDYVGFDWFVSTIYLLNGGNTGKAWNFLYKLSSLVVSGYIWMARLHSSVSWILLRHFQKSVINFWKLFILKIIIGGGGRALSKGLLS